MREKGYWIAHLMILLVILALVAIGYSAEIPSEIAKRMQGKEIEVKMMIPVQEDGNFYYKAAEIERERQYDSLSPLINY